MSEIDIQKQIKKFLEDKGYIVFRYNAGYIKNNVRLHPSGTPDLQVLMNNSKSIWIEVKIPGKEPTDIQLEMHMKIKILGHLVIVAHSVEDIKHL